MPPVRLGGPGGLLKGLSFSKALSLLCSPQASVGQLGACSQQWVTAKGAALSSPSKAGNR